MEMSIGHIGERIGPPCPGQKVLPFLPDPEFEERLKKALKNTRLDADREIKKPDPRCCPHCQLREPIGSTT